MRVLIEHGHGIKSRQVCEIGLTSNNNRGADQGNQRYNCHRTPESTGLATSTVHGYLATMLKKGYLTRDGSDYHIGTKFLRLGGLSDSPRGVHDGCRESLRISRSDR